MEDNTQYRSKYKSKTKYGQLSKLDLQCPECENKIGGEHVNINNSLAKCNDCGSVFKVEEDDFFDGRLGRPEMIMPEGTDVLHLPSSLDIRVNWLKSQPRGALGFITFFTVAWNAFIAIVATGMIASGAFGAIAYLSIHLIVGLGLLYYLLGVYLNYTDVLISHDMITIENRPIKNPFSPSRSIPTENIEQLYVSKYVASTTNGVANYAYALHARLKNGDVINLIKGMNKETQLYLEQEIEHYLEIEDEVIAGSITS